MIPLLSEAIKIGQSYSNDLLLAAYAGSMSYEERIEFSNAGITGYPGRFAHCLLGTYPQLGASVRTWPKLAEELEQKGRIPRIKPFQSKYRREIHVSLWKVITSLQALGQTKGAIADLLTRHLL